MTTSTDRRALAAIAQIVGSSVVELWPDAYTPVAQPTVAEILNRTRRRRSA